MSNKSVDIKKIMAEIKKKASNIDYNGDIEGVDGMPERLPKTLKTAINKEEQRADIDTINNEYYADYDASVDAGSPIRAKLGSMIRVRIAPILARRNRWSASVVRVLNTHNTQVFEMKGAMDNSDPELMKVQINELELKLRMAVKQIEVMNSRISELEKALEKSGEN